MIAFTTFAYALGKTIGVWEAQKLVEDLVMKKRSLPKEWGEFECISTVRAIERIAPLEAIGVYCETSATHMGRARSRAFHWVRQAMQQYPECHTWVSCDDDNTATDATIARLLESVRVDIPRVVCVPYFERGSVRQVDSSAPSVLAADGRVAARSLPTDVFGGKVETHIAGNEPIAGLLPVNWAGMGLVAANRMAVELIADAHRHMLYRDSDGIERLGVFADWQDFAAKEWAGEDTGFWKRIPDKVQKRAVCVGESKHAGMRLDLSQVRLLEVTNG